MRSQSEQSYRNTSLGLKYLLTIFAMDKTHAFGVRDPGSNPLRDTNLSLTLNP